MKQTLNYNIHNVLKIKIVRNRKHDILKNINLPFSYFETDENIDNPDIILNVGAFAPSNNDCYVVEHKFHIKENYLYCKDSEGRVKWELEIFGFEEGKTIINFEGTFFGPEFMISDLIPQEMLLMPMIIYTLSEKGYYLIHAGGVSKDGCAYVFAGRGGSSKTELVMDFVKSGFDYLGDDWVIIHNDKVLPFPKYFSEFVFSLKTGCLPTESFSSIMDKIRYLNYLRKNPSLDNDALKVSNSSALKVLFFVVKTNKGEVNIKNINQNKSIRRLISNNKIEMITSPSIMGKEFGRYYNYMLAYSFVFPDTPIATYWRDSMRNLEEVLKNVPLYEIEIPSCYNQEIYNEIYKFIRELR